VRVHDLQLCGVHVMEIKDADFKRICELAFEAGKIAGRKEGREEMLKEVFTGLFEIANPKSANPQTEVKNP
jgi:hypothetical protein